MPASTPNFGITYPCGGDTIDPSAFQVWADTTQAALNTVQALATVAPNPPSVWVGRQATPQIINFVNTTLSFDTEGYDRGGFWSPGAPTLIIAPENGSYLADLLVFANDLPATTWTSFRCAIALNGVEISYHESDAGSTGIPAGELATSVFIPSITIGTPITATATFTGSGGNPAVTAKMTVTKVSSV